MADVVAIIQARMGSTRLPGKIAMDLCGVTVLGRVIEAVRAAQCFDSIWVATSTEALDDKTEQLARLAGAQCFRGSQLDVRSRFVSVATETGAKLIGSITADNPLSYPPFMRQLTSFAQKHPQVSYVAMDQTQIPYGSGIEVFRAEALALSVSNDPTDEGKEHVTPSLRRASNALLVPDKKLKRPDLRVTIDTPEDFARVSAWYRDYGSSPDLLATLCEKIQL